MDILVKGMEMPKERKMFVIEADGSVWVQIKDTSYFCTGSKAVALTSHGRLIDADAIISKIEIMVHPDDLEHTIAHGILKQIIEDAETIVEANNGTDNQR